MMASIVGNWLFALLVEKTGKKKLFLILDIICNLSVLFVFKYLSFALTSISALFKTEFVIPQIALPIGISFFTFQAMSYVIDVYRGDATALPNVLDVGLYISLFPQLVAGPIVRYTDIADQIENRKESYSLFANGVSLFCVGLAKKAIIANNIALVADKAFVVGDRSIQLAWLGIIAYTLQIYFDFSGYSDMAIGLGCMFGFRFNKNFDAPYTASSITDFWRRWHISMGSWFRDYVYFPLGGSRVESRARIVWNLLVVWLLTGLWHGANWTFVFWGLLQFMALMLEKLTGFNKVKKGFLVNSFKHIYTMLIVMLGWVFFRSDSLADAFAYIETMFSVGNFRLDSITVSLVRNYYIVLLLAIVFCVPMQRHLHRFIHSERMIAVFKVCFCSVCFVLSIIYVAKGSYNPFIYFNF